MIRPIVMTSHPARKSDWFKKLYLMVRRELQQQFFSDATRTHLVRCINISFSRAPGLCIPLIHIVYTERVCWISFSTAAMGNEVNSEGAVRPMTLSEKTLCHNAIGLSKPEVRPGDMICVKVCMCWGLKGVGGGARYFVALPYGLCLYHANPRLGG